MNGLPCGNNISDFFSLFNSSLYLIREGKKTIRITQFDLC